MLETLILIVILWIALNAGFVLGALFAALLAQAKRVELSEEHLQITIPHPDDEPQDVVSVRCLLSASTTTAPEQLRKSA